jgi:hypothetical protein
MPRPPVDWEPPVAPEPPVPLPPLPVPFVDPRGGAHPAPVIAAMKQMSKPNGGPKTRGRHKKRTRHIVLNRNKNTNDSRR